MFLVDQKTWPSNPHAAAQRNAGRSPKWSAAADPQGTGRHARRIRGVAALCRGVGVVWTSRPIGGSRTRVTGIFASMNDDELDSDKGDVYYCSWEKTKNGTYAGWEKKRPFLRVEVASKQELLSKLGDVVGEHYSDFEAAIHFDPPLEAGDGNDGLFADGFTEIGWNETFTFRPSRDTAFVGGRCKRCGAGIGARAGLPLVVDSRVEGDGAFSAPTFGPAPGNGDPGWLTIVSEEFLRLLTTDERAQFGTRPVKWEPRRRKAFFELIPKRFISPVAIKGLEINGHRCEVCGRRTYSHGKALGWTVEVICRSDLPSPLPPCFFVGDATEMRFYTTRKRLNQLYGRAGARKLHSTPLAVINERSCLRQPWLPTMDEMQDFRQRHNLYQWAMIVSVGEPGILRGYPKDMRSYVEGKVSS